MRKGDYGFEGIKKNNKFNERKEREKMHYGKKKKRAKVLQLPDESRRARSKERINQYMSGMIDELDMDYDDI